MTFYVHFGGNGGPYLTLGYSSKRKALAAIRESLREGWPARLG
jgi:hypothetical protein